MKIFKRLTILLSGAAILLLSALLLLRAWQPGLETLEDHQAAAPASRGGLQVSWHGVSAVLIDDGETALFIDPFFSRPPGLLPLLLNASIEPDVAAVKQGLARAGASELAAVLVSHSHFDHAMDAGVVARLSGAQLVGSESTLNVGRGAGLPAHQLRLASDEQARTFGQFRVRFIRSRHAGATGGRPTGDIESPLTVPANYLDYRQGGSFSILIEHPAGRLLHHGSAGFQEHALSEYQADVVMLGVALVDDWPEYFRQTVDAVGASQVVPLHWDDFTRPLSQPLRPLPLAVRLDRYFEHMQTRPDLRTIALPLIRPVTLPAS